jgi:hypothetical protein
VLIKLSHHGGEGKKRKGDGEEEATAARKKTTPAKSKKPNDDDDDDEEEEIGGFRASDLQFSAMEEEDVLQVAIWPISCGEDLDDRSLADVWAAHHGFGRECESVYGDEAGRSLEDVRTYLLGLGLTENINAFN